MAGKESTPAASAAFKALGRLLAGGPSIRLEENPTGWVARNVQGRTASVLEISRAGIAIEHRGARHDYPWPDILYIGWPFNRYTLNLNPQNMLVYLYLRGGCLEQPPDPRAVNPERGPYAGDVLIPNALPGFGGTGGTCYGGLTQGELMMLLQQAHTFRSGRAYGIDDLTWHVEKKRR